MTKNLENIKLSFEHDKYIWAESKDLENLLYYKGIAKSIQKYIENK